MREKNLAISLLLDFYGEVLTEKQREVVNLYYNEDLSLAEIAEQAQITRQGVRDCIKRGEATLLEMEEKLGLSKRFSDMQREVSRIKKDAETIEEINNRYCFSGEIGELAKRIHETAQMLEE